jgi:hypothetical protein
VRFKVLTAVSRLQLSETRHYIAQKLGPDTPEELAYPSAMAAGSSEMPVPTCLLNYLASYPHTPNWSSFVPDILIYPVLKCTKLGEQNYENKKLRINSSKLFEYIDVNFKVNVKEHVCMNSFLENQCISVSTVIWWLTIYKTTVS